MKKIISIASLLAVILTACSRESGPDSACTGEKVSFRVVPTVVGSSVSGDLHTRARVTADDGFATGSQVGLAIEKAAAPALAAYYDNFRALHNGTTWEYWLNNSPVGTMLSGFSDWNLITLRGYYPYDASVTDLSAVPFSIAAQGAAGEASAYEDQVSVDYMVAGPQSKDMFSDPVLLELEFNHLFTAIDVKLRKAYVGPALKLVRATFEIGGTREFGIAGTYNAKNPNMTDLGTNVSVTPLGIRKLDVSYNSSKKTFGHNTVFNAGNTSPLIIMPELRQNAVAGNEDATVKITLYFEDTDGNPFVFEDVADDGNGNPVISFALSSVDNTAAGSADRGLLAGCVYSIEVAVGTYVKFSGAPVIIGRDIEDADNDDDSQFIEI